ncbi:MAG: bifunctional metallophosphatase/5'-nucleotidase [Prevotella sp.]
MRHITLLLLIAIMAIPAIGRRPKRLTILHTNDTHSCVLPMNPNLADTLVAGRGGFLRRITMLKAERAADPDLLYFDSGDFCQGSAYFSLFKGEVEVELMNRMGVTAATIGNHEWDNGMERLVDMIRQARFPFVCANYDFSDTPLMGLVKPYTIIRRKGVKIGVFGLGPKLEGLVDKKNYCETRYLDPVSTARETARVLKEEYRCDVIICISHLGWGEEGDMAMIRGTRYIDLVLGGHSHSRFTELQHVRDLDMRDVPVDQNGKSAIYVGKIVLELEKKKGASSF